MKRVKFSIKQLFVITTMIAIALAIANYLGVIRMGLWVCVFFAAEILFAIVMVFRFFRAAGELKARINQLKLKRRKLEEEVRTARQAAGRTSSMPDEDP